MFLSDFPTIRTNAFDFKKNEKPEFLEVKQWRSAYDSKFDFSLSVKVNYDAHIFICDDQNPLQSQCYWILLGYNSGKKSGIRKCDKNSINATTGYPIGSCKKFLDNVSEILFLSFNCATSAFTGSKKGCIFS